MEIRQAAEGNHTLAETTDTTWVIDTDPGDDSSYSRIRAHISKADHVARKVEFFDGDGELVKVLEVVKTETQGDVVVPVESVMKNVQKGTHTQLLIESQKLDVSTEELPDDTFTKEYLERSG
jgi:hypothetical protein